MWLASCLASFTMDLAVVIPSTTHVRPKPSVGRAICLRRLGFVIFQTGNPNACSYGIQIWYEIPRGESRPGLAHTNRFFHVRMAAGAYRRWGSFSSSSTSARALVEPLRVGAGLEDLQDQTVKMHPLPTLLAVIMGLFFG